ncbi:MAG: S9 family peptidase [Tissierellia bacterium]|nr:S9 family peptidase [Tissierellia bacterium]
MKNLEIKDFVDYDFNSDVKISYDGKNIAFIKTKANLDDNKYESDLYQYNKDLDLLYQVTDFKDVNTFLFNHRNELLFKRSDEKYDYIYKKDLNPSIASEYFKLEKNISFIKELKDDIFLIKASNKKTEEEKKKDNENSYYQKIDTLPFWFNGSSYLKFEQEEFFIYDKEKNEIKNIINTQKEDQISAFDIDEDFFVYVNGKYPNGLMNLYDDIFVYDLKNNTNKKILEQKFSIYDIFLLDKKIFFIGNDMKNHGINQDPFVYSINIDGTDLKKITDDNFDMDFGNSVGTDVRYGHFKTIKKSKNEIYFIATQKDKSKLFKIDNCGKVELIYDKENVEDFDLIDDNLALITMTKESLSKIYLNDKKIVESKSTVKPEKIKTFTFKSNGSELLGYVLFPKDYDQNKKYPALLSIHGGPKTVFSDIYHHEHQIYAKNGYFVFYTNPHGSSSHGVKYSDIRGKYGNIDYEDLMNFTDCVLDKYPQIDKDRLGVLGGSYGGFMTNWIIGHTDRFKAANSQRSISNWTSFYGVSDIGFYFASDQTDSNMWDNLEKMWNQSPIKYAKNVKTPTLFIHSDCDYRCPLEQGLQMYSAIKLNNVETKMYIFKDENHELSRSGKPKARIKRITEILKWFDEHLK